MDAIDRRILRALHRRARLTNAELAEEVGLSPSPCWTRVRRLEAAGVIQGYVAILDQAALGLPDTVIIEVMMERHDDEQLRRFEQAVTEMPEVIEAWLEAHDSVTSGDVVELTGASRPTVQRALADLAGRTMGREGAGRSTRFVRLSR